MPSPTKHNETEIRAALASMHRHRATYGLLPSQIDLAASHYESYAVLSKLSPRELAEAERIHERAVAAAVARLHPEIV